MQRRSNATSYLELFLLFGLSINTFLLSAAPSECCPQLYLVNYTAKQKLREVRYYDEFIEQGLDDKNLIMTEARLYSGAQ